MTQWTKLLSVLGVAAVGLLALSYLWASQSGSEGQFLSALPASVGVLAVGLAAVFVVGRMSAASEVRPFLKTFCTVAVRLDGWVRHNMMGEFQLHLPHPLGGLIVALTSETEGVLPGAATGRWTSFCFVSDSFRLPSLEFRVGKGKALSHPSLNPEALRALALVRDVDLSALRVKVHSRTSGKSGPAIEVWLPGWPQSTNELTAQIHALAPQLVALADALSRR